MRIQLKRYKGNPILKPTENWWESRWVYNPAAILDEGKVKLLYRARGEDYFSRFGYAESKDGLKISKRLELPVFESNPRNEFEKYGVEDPRITKIGDVFYITYVAASIFPANYPLPTFAKPYEAPWRCRASLLRTTDLKNFERLGIMRFSNMDQKDVVLFPEKIGGKYVAFHRKFPGIWIAYSDDLVNWTGDKLVLNPRSNSWEEDRVGAGNPPIKTEYGWLMFYHACNKKYTYRVSAVLFDLGNPSKIVAKLDYPILEPKRWYEKKGIVPNVFNVVFTSGAVEKNGQYFIYYGGGDSVICVATIEKEKLLSALIKIKNAPHRRSKLTKKAKRKIKKLKKEVKK